MIWFFLPWVGVFIVYEVIHLGLNSASVMTLADEVWNREVTMGRRRKDAVDPETAKRLRVEAQMRDAANAKRKLCKHREAVSVDNDVLGHLAWWCPDCETQLPPEFDPNPVPHNGWGREIEPKVGTVAMMASPSDYLLPPNTVCQSCGGSAEDAWKLGYTGRDWAEAYGKPLCPVCDKAMRRRERDVEYLRRMNTAVGQPVMKPAVDTVWQHHIMDAKEYAKAAKANNAAHLERLAAMGFNEYDPQSPGWTIQNGHVPTNAGY